MTAKAKAVLRMVQIVAHSLVASYAFGSVVWANALVEGLHLSFVASVYALSACLKTAVLLSAEEGFEGPEPNDTTRSGSRPWGGRLRDIVSGVT